MEKFSSIDMDAATTGVDSDRSRTTTTSRTSAGRCALTNSGEFLHAAPWSVGSQGRANVSHGCTGMSTADAEWLYDQSERGDVVKYVNSPRPLEDRNGWTDWNVPWETWTSGSALQAADTAATDVVADRTRCVALRARSVPSGPRTRTCDSCAGHRTGVRTKPPPAELAGALVVSCGADQWTRGTPVSETPWKSSPSSTGCRRAQPRCSSAWCTSSTVGLSTRTVVVERPRLGPQLGLAAVRRSDTVLVGLGRVPRGPGTDRARSACTGPRPAGERGARRTRRQASAR